jgi:hypothetical protein
VPAALRLVGRRFSRLTVIERDPTARYASWRCRCDCGEITVVRTEQLTGGGTRSCGCLQRDVVRTRNRTHGQTGSSEYTAWRNALARCYNPRNRDFPNYGGRGITMCDRWRSSFDAFVADLGERPVGLTLERIDTNGPYAPGNCRWASRTEQGNNQRDNVRLTHQAETLTLAEWARRTGVSYDTLHKRMRRGWPVERVLHGISPRPNTT